MYNGKLKSFPLALKIYFYKREKYIHLVFYKPCISQLNSAFLIRDFLGNIDYYGQNLMMVHFVEKLWKNCSHIVLQFKYIFLIVIVVI